MVRWIAYFIGTLCIACTRAAPPSALASSASGSSTLGAASSPELWWAPELGVSSLQAIPARLDEPFADPYDTATLLNGNADQKTVSNCIEYLRFLPLGYQPLAVNDATRYRLEGCRCQAIKALEAARPAQRDSLEKFSLQDESVLSILPPLLGPAPSPLQTSERERATQQGSSWRMVDPGARVTAANACKAKIIGPGWTTEIQVLARADFNGDSSEDLLIQTFSYGTEGGDWTEVKLRVLTRVSGKAVLAIILEIPV
jgi:hypothetical protein